MIIFNELPLILPSTSVIALSLFLEHHHCLLILRSEREAGVFFLVLNISNIGLGLMEIIHLTYVANWLAGFCMVFTGFIWHISDK